MLSNTAHSLEDAKFFFDCEPKGALTCISNDRQEVVHNYLDAERFFAANLPAHGSYRDDDDIPTFMPTSDPLDFGSSTTSDDVDTSFDTPDTSSSSSDFGNDSGSSDFGGGGSGGEY